MTDFAELSFAEVVAPDDERVVVETTFRYPTSNKYYPKSNKYYPTGIVGIILKVTGIILQVLQVLSNR